MLLPELYVVNVFKIGEYHISSLLLRDNLTQPPCYQATIRDSRVRAHWAQTQVHSWHHVAPLPKTPAIDLDGYYYGHGGLV